MHGGQEREVDSRAAGTLVGLAGKLAEWNGRQVTLLRHVTQTLGWDHGHCDGPCDACKPSLCASDLGASPQTLPLCIRPSAQKAGGRYLRRFLPQWQLATKSL